VDAAIEALGLGPEQTRAVIAARAELVRYGRRMVADRLIDEDAVCVVAADGHQIGGTGRPSSELPMHRMIYESTDAGAVAHTHSVAAVAASTVCDELPAVHYSILRLGGPTVRVAAYETFGSDGLARSAGAALADRYGALLQNHGAITYGSTLAEAYQRAELIEWLAEVWARACGLGQPRILGEAELAAVSEAARRRRYIGAGG
jgi:L-fuculose-phosphate aldolase